MKRVIYLLVVAVVLVCGCGKNENEGKTGGIINGTIIDQSTGDPIPVVSVQLSPGESNTVTGSDGFYQFENVASDDYTLIALKESYKDVNVSVSVSGGTIKKDITMEREAAIVKVDRNELDFGSDAGVTQLSFSLVNSSREDLAWSITTNCKWIESISPNSGTLQFGKTQPVQVTIDRGKLAEGNF